MFKNIFFLLIPVLTAFSLQAQTVEDLQAEAQALEKQMNEAGALQKYKEVLKIQPANVPALVQSSLLAVKEGFRQKDKEAKQTLYNEAKAYAEQALQADASNAQANFAMAVVLGRIGLISPAKEKVAAAKEVKKYADLALRFNPDYGEAYHLLGKWNFELANMSSLERTAAKVLFGGVPPGTIQDAIANYEKCRKLKPGYIINYYDLAIAYHQDNKDTEAMEILKKVNGVRPVFQDDVQTKAEAKKMLEGLQ
ncbi:hypothetical protein MKQ68_03995 [Chitinophaga horti]|uniref:Regulator of microtubule dynamics protein 1 n=1 Tax=Chitinophaga horti TaxID=2920382 RepID=A0ABY6J6M3_9BACT|nr:hypothetical protein [Chitinophaga horti]UYQ94252.1 hypothetical protein MKQ68_03995 [Chitinophaga horti]